MNKATAAERVGRFALVICLALALFGLIFRSTLYWKIPVEPGDPYGFGDVLEYLVWIALLVAALFSGAWGVMLTIVKGLGHRVLGMWLIAVSLGSVVGYRFLHGLMPRLVDSL
jgi:hypothetical protein